MHAESTRTSHIVNVSTLLSLLIAFVVGGGNAPRAESATLAIDGCLSLHITIAPPKTVRVARIGRSCGPLAIEVDSGARFDPKRRTVEFSVSLLNLWTRELVAPARLYAWPDSFALATFSGPTVKGKPYLILPVNADSVIGSGPASALVWRFDSLLGNPERGTLLPGQRSKSRVVRLKIREGGAADFVITLRAQAQNTHVFTENPPVMA